MIHPDDYDNPASISEAVQEWARNCGAPPDRAWLLHDRDVWIANRAYDGPPVPHPENDDGDSPRYERGFRAAAAAAKASAERVGVHYGTIPVEGYPGWFQVKAYPRKTRV